MSLKKRFFTLMVLLALLAPLFPFGILADENVSKDPFFSAPVSEASARLMESFPETEFIFGESVHDWYKFLLLEALTALPEKHTRNLDLVAINDFDLARRGLVSFRLEFASNTPQVKLRLNPLQFPIETGFFCQTVQECLQVTAPLINQEFTAVAVHEIGHAIDLGKSTQGFPASGRSSVFQDGDFPFYRDDPSLAFYSLCFASESTLAKHCGREDFVSGYAKTSAFEDFGETMTVYVLDGENFYQRAIENARKNQTVLLSKYNFFRERIFDGQEFRLPKRPRRNLFTTHDASKRYFALKSFWLQY